MEPIILHIDTKEVIRGRLPVLVRSKICTIVEKAYSLTREAIKQTTLLNWELGAKHEGYLRNIAIGYLFKQQIDLGNLPFSYSYEYNRNRSYKFIVLSFENIKISFSQVQARTHVARPAYFRNKLQLLNQGEMYFSDMDPNIPSNADDCYLLLTYSRGGSEPKFVNIGFPHQWNERIDLLKETRVLASDNPQVAPEETITPETLIEFRNYVKEVEGLGSE
ncbi:hypothetical protein OM416_31375 [Paenibacillus sp. LS1]|uniref:hypothetical protein n=1 Tax=Paenibacillus sp. LS1 TaxID=2992120 RepID=UPI00222FB65E|nr:hypothetical protein [Paenibacillus sp. LS1]MCW3796095.1 hypothetical protein [Paenibacillus sp. LS1]